MWLQQVKDIQEKNMTMFLYDLLPFYSNAAVTHLFNLLQASNNLTKVRGAGLYTYTCIVSTV